MSIDISTLTDADEWNDLVDQSPQATPFHRYETLSVIADHSGGTLHPYAGFKGQEPVGLFPVFELSKGPANLAFSPPPNLKVTYLGPIQLNYKKQKQRRRERTNRRFIRGCLERMDETIDPLFTHVYTGVRYDDARPFVWSDFDPLTRYTFLVDLRPTEEDLIMGFSSDSRQNIRNTDETEYEIYAGGEADVERTMRRVKQRHEEQDATFNVPPEFAVDLYHELPDHMMRVYVCEVDGAFAGGHITLELDDTIYGWQSWGDHDARVPVNDLLEWTIMTQAKDRDIEWYDLVGANTERLSKYKAKFNPELRTYQRLQRGKPGMSLVSKLYKRIR